MIKGDDIYIRPFTGLDSVSLLNLQTSNREFFEKFSMSRSSHYYSLDNQMKLIEKWNDNQEKDREYNFGIFKSESDELIGTVNLFQVIRGSLQSAFIGYFLAEKQNGKGYTTKAVKLIVDYAFNNLQLHRIEAGVMPHNIGSIRVLEKAGFHKEGIAKKNVKINGRWEDHQVLAIIHPND
ncbi:GNAT family N-acetyltransferase [Cytobacillus purgationiresistens]|uniref:Ribosomal-protein-alanine N-acetyltransferase n=1 Tax=Cytobacillus purgationiresistens TaxID=863449 RepID=A0ABU0ARD4_9BACI|nr:GNAT family protein [Cytobacillus purgationiresistens]MDQ0273824.1 ribosomal-protein-alanine N-acetyltransferase [Cytobacillus purgationiresistens]